MATPMTDPIREALEADLERVEQTLGESVICSRCGATLATYAELCNVPLNVPCPGFITIENVRKRP